MVEYKKKKIILQSGGTRNFYYKISSDGKKTQVSKKEYLEKKGGNPNDIKILTPNEEKFLSSYDNSNPNHKKLKERLKKDFERYLDERELSNTYKIEHLKKYENYPEYKRIQNEKKERRQKLYNSLNIKNLKPKSTNYKYKNKITYNNIEDLENDVKYLKLMDDELEKLFESEKKLLAEKLSISENDLRVFKVFIPKFLEYIRNHKKNNNINSIMEKMYYYINSYFE